MVSVLFVCLGNICRSPAAEGVLKHFVGRHPELDIHVESCGIGDWHVGQLPDSRMCRATENRGITLVSRAQVFDPAFLEAFDYILAADKSILHELYQHAKSTELKAKIHLITQFSKTYREEDIPDPYFKGTDSFELVLDMLEDSCQGLLEKIHQTR